MITMIVSIYSVAVMCAVYPKDSWALFQKKRKKFFPAIGYLLSGIAAVVMGIPISLIFKTLIYSKGDPNLIVAASIAWDQFVSVSYPWMFMAFATAIITAFIIDFEPPEKLPAKWTRWLEAAMQAAATALASLLVHWWLGESAPIWYRVLIVSATVGFVLGFIVPTWSQMADQTASSKVRAQETGADSDRAAVTLSS
jgi:amino acid transporter